MVQQEDKPAELSAKESSHVALSVVWRTGLGCVVRVSGLGYRRRSYAINLPWPCQKTVIRNKLALAMPKGRVEAPGAAARAMRGGVSTVVQDARTPHPKAPDRLLPPACPGSLSPRPLPR